MKIIKSSVNVIQQMPGISGMKKQIELIGKVSHKSESGITDTSYLKFIDNMKKIGHWAVFDMATAYLSIPLTRLGLIKKLVWKHPWTKIQVHGFRAFISTPYRVIIQESLESEMEKYWCEPGPYHKIRATAHFVCSRFVANQLVRHASLRPLQESQRYCNYEKAKFGSEITYILPQWVYGVREEIGNTVDSLTGDLRTWILEKDGEELWKSLCCFDRTVASRDEIWRKAEDEYKFEVTSEESTKLLAEDARGCLPGDTKTELYLCGYLDDWYKRPLLTPERTGFFYLRSDKSAQSDVRVLSQELEKQFKELGYDRLLH